MIERAQRQWDSGQFPGEGEDEEHVYVFGWRAPFLSLLQAAPGLSEAHLDWPADDPSRFGGLARLLWDPILEVEEHGS
jgi:hypothetical protein